MVIFDHEPDETFEDAFKARIYLITQSTSNPIFTQVIEAAISFGEEVYNYAYNYGYKEGIKEGGSE
jgi:hypothetical protein